VFLAQALSEKQLDPVNFQHLCDFLNYFERWRDDSAGFEAADISSFRLGLAYSEFELLLRQPSLFAEYSKAFPEAFGDSCTHWEVDSTEKTSGAVGR
jgi:hypothetical protein